MSDLKIPLDQLPDNGHYGVLAPSGHRGLLLITTTRENTPRFCSILWHDFISYAPVMTDDFRRFIAESATDYRFFYFQTLAAASDWVFNGKQMVPSADHIVVVPATEVVFQSPDFQYIPQDYTVAASPVLYKDTTPEKEYSEMMAKVQQAKAAALQQFHELEQLKKQFDASAKAELGGPPLVKPYE